MTLDDLWQAELAASDAYEAALNAQMDHPASCDACRGNLPPTVQPGSLLSIYMARCEAAPALDAATGEAFEAWLKAHGAHYRARYGLEGKLRELEGEQ